MQNIFLFCPITVKKQLNQTTSNAMTSQISLRLKNHNNCELFESQTGLGKKTLNTRKHWIVVLS